MQYFFVLVLAFCLQSNYGVQEKLFPGMMHFMEIEISYVLTQNPQHMTLSSEEQDTLMKNTAQYAITNFKCFITLFLLKWLSKHGLKHKCRKSDYERDQESQNMWNQRNFGKIMVTQGKLSKQNSKQHWVTGIGGGETWELEKKHKTF